MRLWRGNLPSEPAPEDEAPGPDEAGALRQPEPEFDVEERQPAEPAAWFWRRRAPAEPSPETEFPAADEVKSPEAPASVEAEAPPTRPEAPLPSPPLPAPGTGPGLDPGDPGDRGDAGITGERRVGVEPQESGDRHGWFARLRAGLSRSSTRLNDGINAIFLRRRLDEEALEELEDLLISSDMGVGIAGEVTQSLRRTRFNQEVSPEEVRTALAEQVIRLIEPVTRPLRIDRSHKPFVILVIGVNGSGKTTTIAKLAKQYRDEGMQVVLAAGDTFRAAAVEQLQIWGERTGTAVVTRPPGSDAAGLAYDALLQARSESADVLLIDTAGRLHNKADLMGELQKIVRVLKKVDADAPHSVLLVLDATTGQNAHAQAETFREMVGVTGIVMTKLDGTARGGVLVSLAEKYGIPIHAIGIGETADDLRPFEARAYARSLVGLEP
jgi:fused signal recognition particle receptor